MNYFARTRGISKRHQVRSPGFSPRRGFSLIEMMVVVALLAIIALIAVPSYNWAMRKARRAEGKALLYVIMAAEERQYSNTNRYVRQPSELGIVESTESQPGHFYALSDILLSDDEQAVTITVSPQHAQQSDACGSLTLDSAGRRGSAAEGASGAGCW